MPRRQIEIPSLGRSLSVLMAAPSSAGAHPHGADLHAYYQQGGNALHLHGEGGETHSRQSAGEWLRARHLRQAFFLCTQICHDDWDDTLRRPINRFLPEAVHQDITADLQLIGTDFLDLVYLDDRPQLPLEPVIEAIGDEIASGRVRSFGVRNFTAERLRAAHALTAKTTRQGIAAVVTTELSLFAADRPLWPEYVPFDAALMQTVAELGLAVLAHAGDLTLGQCLFGDEDSMARLRPEWVARWQTPNNVDMASHVQHVATAQRRTPREIQMAWLLNQPFPVIAILNLPAFGTESGRQYERGSQIPQEDAERLLQGVCRPSDGFSRD